MIRKIPHILLICFLYLSTYYASGQQTGTGIFRLGTDDLKEDESGDGKDILSASRTLKDLEDIPYTVHIISRQEILENGYITLVDVLKSVPGIRVSQPGSAAEGEMFMIRGLHGNYYCKILVDGVPVQPSVVNGMPISAQLPVRQAERIEITFGPSSSVYGADALAGVINIVTFTSERPVTAQADIALGNDGQEYLNVSIGGKAGKNRNVLTYSLFGSNFHRNDMGIKQDVAGVYDPHIYDSTYGFLSAPYYHGDSSAPELDKLPESARLLGFSFKWRGLSLQVLSMNREIHSSIGQRTDVFSYAHPGSFWGEKMMRFTLAYSLQRKKFSSITTLSYLNYRLDNQTTLSFIQPVGPTGTVYKYAASDDIFLEQQFTFIPLPSLEITTGLNYTLSGNLPRTNDLYEPFETGRYSPFSTEPLSDTVFGSFGYHTLTFYDLGGFAQLYFKKGRFVVIASERYDYHSRYRGSNNLRFALQYAASPEISVRLGAGQGFRAPSTYYTYLSQAYRQGDSIYYVTVPNEDLKPEKLFSTELGVRWNPVPTISLDASVFYHRLNKQFTRTITVLDPEQYPLASNEFLISHFYVNDDTSRAELFGLQATLSAQDLIRPVNLTTDLLLSVSRGREVLASPRGSSDSYRQWPVFMGQLNISLRPARFLYLRFSNLLLSGWTREYLPLGLDILEKSGYETTRKGYYTLDLLARISITRNFHAFFQLNNLFNEKYAGLDAYGTEYDLRYNPQFGRNFRLGLSFSFE